jgi:hypothetical protein
MALSDQLDKKTLIWKASSLAAGTLAGVATERLLGLIWTRMSGNQPPLQADRRISWPTAVSWAAATGVGVAVARLVANRSAAVVWERVTDDAPPDVARQRAA